MPNTGFSVNGADLDKNLVPKSYLMDRYPELANTFKTAGLWLWGPNGVSGALGDNTTITKSSPVQTVASGANWKQVSVSGGNCGAIKTDGTLWVWGSNNYLKGQLGDNTQTNRSSPVQTVAGGNNWKQVSFGQTYCGAIKTDGTLWMWGDALYGKLGDNTTQPKSSPIQTVAAGTNWKELSLGQYTTAAIKTDGTLWTWGFNNYGELGNNVGGNRSSPVQTIAAGTNWKQVSAGSVTAAIKTDGTLWTWGRNNVGQLGDNTRTNRSSPIQTIASGNNWKQVSSGSNPMIAAIKTDGTLWTWGRNDYGELGDNTITNKSSPVQTVAGGTNWKQVSYGSFNCYAIKTDGTLWTWGYNNQGQLGDNTTTNKSSPIQTVAGGNNWKQVSAGSPAAAIRDDSADFGIGTL